MKKNTKKEINKSKCKNIHIRLSIQDYKLLHSVTQNKKITMLDILKLGLYGETQEQMDKKISLLSNATNNLNQIAKYYNTHKDIQDKEFLHNTLIDINNQLRNMEILYTGIEYNNEDIKKKIAKTQ